MTSSIYATHHSDFYGCISSRLWNCLGSQIHPGYMVFSLETSPYQSKGVACCSESVPIYSYSSPLPSSVMYGQHVGDRLHQTFWRHQIFSIENGRSRYLDTLLLQLHTAINFIRPPQIESSGCSIASDSVPGRMVTSNYLLHETRTPLGSPPS